MKKLSLFFFIALFFMMPLDAGAYATTKREIYSEIAENFMDREEEFFVECPYNSVVDSLVMRLNSPIDEIYYSALFEIADVTDKSYTLDDGDYLYANLAEVYCEYIDEAGLYFYNVKYFETKAQTRKVNRKIAKQAKKIKSQARTREMRIRLAYEYTIDQIRYDYRENCNYSAFAGLYRNKTTVCNGYAMVLYKLLNEMNIPCRFISGSVDDNGWQYLHAWNIVKLNGRWYNLDATNDDGDDGRDYKNYYLVSDGALTIHTKDFFYLTDKFQKKHRMAAWNY